MKLVPGMGVRIVQIGAGRGMGIPVIGGTELRSTTAGDQVLPVANFIAMHPIVSQRRNGFLFAADFAGLRSFLRTGWSGLLPGMIPCCRDIPGFGKAASRTDSGLPSVCGAGRSRGLFPVAPAMHMLRRLRLGRLWFRRLWLGRRLGRRLCGRLRWLLAWR